jgi:glucose-6-phosphate isomerase
MTQPENSWSDIFDHALRLSSTSLKALFDADPGRFDSFSTSLDDLLIDFSREKLDARSLQSLLALARSSGVDSARSALFSGAKVNNTEQRAVLHMALRDGCGQSVEVDGEDVMPAVREERDRFLQFAEAVRSGDYPTVDGEGFSDVVSIGIGGSDLGPVMVTGALRPWHDGPRIHYVSNVDGAHLHDTLTELNPRRTLLVVSSKTFTTLETMTNAHSARAWLEASLGDEKAGAHVAAVSTNLEATQAFGIDDDRVFGFWDWVGGRYSVWSAIGLPVAIAIGEQRFRQFLAGAASMDQHFQQAPLEQNLPVLLALIGVWRRNALKMPTVAIIPYDQRLARFPAYTQQLDMESNGKRTTRDSQPIGLESGPVIWGEAGTNAQHSFFQLIHQGADKVPVDFLMAARPAACDDPADYRIQHHHILLANLMAQAKALAFGRAETEVRSELANSGMPPQQIDLLAAHKTFPGDRPSTIIACRELTPYALGRLIALYEHKVFVQGVIWNVNSYDQWGVELGKVLASEITPALADNTISGKFDCSTSGILRYVHNQRQT